MRRATVRGELRCEGCGEPARLDFAHLFRRGNIIAEPWCSLPEMAAALCRTCHRRIDEARDPRLLVALRFRALQRLRERFPRANLAIDLVGPDDDLVLAARIAERVLRERVEEQELPSFAPRWR